MSSLRKEFLEQIQKKKADSPGERKAYEATFRQLAEYEQGKDTKIEDGVDQDWFLDFCEYAEVKSVSRFNKCRQYLAAYLRFLIQNGAPIEDSLSEVESSVYTMMSGGSDTLFLKNLNTLKNYISLAVHTKDVPDDTVFDQAACILYLSWYGFTKDEMRWLLKSDVKEAGVLHDGKLVEMEPFVMSVLHRFRDSEGFYREGRHLTFVKYKPSQYLFRSAKSETASDTNIKQSVFRLTNGTDFKILSIKNAFESGVFFRLFMDENVNNLNLRELSGEEISERLHCGPTRHARSEKMREYQRYKEMFK